MGWSCELTFNGYNVGPIPAYVKVTQMSLIPRDSHVPVGRPVSDCQETRLLRSTDNLAIISSI
jgi:hypothetical protein